jgi:hypothetical protein
MPRTMRLEYPGAFYHMICERDQPADQVDCDAGADWHFQGGEASNDLS